MSSFNHKQAFLDKVPTSDAQADVCSTGAGAFFHGDWLYHSFIFDAPEVSMLHINYKEVLAIYSVAKQWATSWSGHHIVIHSDNMAAVAIINKGTCKVVMGFLRDLFWLSAVCNFRIIQLSTFQGLRRLLRMIFHICMMDFICTTSVNFSHHGTMAICMVFWLCLYYSTYLT